VKKFLQWFPTVLIVGAVYFAVMSMVNDSQIVDEIPHVGAGYSYVSQQDARLNPEHPPLAKDLAGIPLLFMNLSQDVFSSRHWLTGINDQWEFGRLLIYNSDNDADKIKFYSRLPMLLFYILSAILILKWGTELYGRPAGFLALVLFLFSPTVMAHSRFVTTDVPALFGVLISIYSLVHYLNRPTRMNMLIAGVMLGLALLFKYNTILLLPFIGFICLAHGYVYDRHTHGHWRMALRQGFSAALIILVAFIFVVWPVYGFHVLNYPVERQTADTSMLLSSFGNRIAADTVVWMSQQPYIRALGQYALGLLMVVQRSGGGNTIYFLGEVKNQGGPLYFPLVYFLKEPLAWWFMVFIAITGAAYRSLNGSHLARKTQEWMYNHFAEMVMISWMVLYWAVSIKSTLNIGIRHMLPTYPFAILLVAGSIVKTGDWLRHHQRKFVTAFSGVIAVFLGWYVYENLYIYPYYLTYFNQAAGGPSGGYKYVADSNLDWGQDLKRLAQFVDKQGIERVSLDYFGWADPTYYLQNRIEWTHANSYSNARDFIARNKSDGWIAVSATFFLQASTPNADRPHSPLQYTWLSAYEPVTVIGNSIFVWHITR